jgi:hypothetical protein
MEETFNPTSGGLANTPVVGQLPVLKVSPFDGATSRKGGFGKAVSPRDGYKWPSRAPARAGADSMARFLLGLAAEFPESTAELAPTGDGLAVPVRLGDWVDSVATMTVHGDTATGIRMVRNPDEMTPWS